jgi:predicted MFS family arabinose efflux permease
MSALPPPSPAADSGLSPGATLAIGIAGFSTFLGLYATQPLLPHFERVFHASKAEAALTVSASTTAVALFAPLVGLVADRASRRRVIVASLIALSALTALGATASGLGSLTAWRFAEGAAIPGAYVLCLAYLAEEAGPRALGRALAAFVAGNVLGGLGGRVISGAVTAAADWRAAFVVLGLVRLAGAVLTWKLLPPSRRFTPREGRGPGLGAIVACLGEPRVRATCAVGFFILLSLVAPFTYAGFYLSAAPFRLGPGAIGALFSLYLVGAIVTPIAGPWVDRVGARLVLAASSGVGAVGIALTLVPSIAVVLVGLAVLSSAAFVAQVAAASHLRAAAPARLRSLASGMYVTAYYAGGSVGGLVPGTLWDRAGWAGCVAIVVVAQVAAVTIAWRGWAMADRTSSPSVTLEEAR